MPRLRHVAFLFVALISFIGLLAIGDWLISPSLMSATDIQRQLMVESLRWYMKHGKHKTVWVGVVKNRQVVDFSAPDMAFWKDSGYPVREFSFLEHAGLGEMRDKVTKESGDGVVLIGFSQEGRATFKVNLVFRSGFDASGGSLAFTRHLWGWRFNGEKPFYDF